MGLILSPLMLMQKQKFKPSLSLYLLKNKQNVLKVKNVISILKNSADWIIALPPHKPRPKTLANRAFFRVKCSHISPAF